MLLFAGTKSNHGSTCMRSSTCYSSPTKVPCDKKDLLTVSPFIEDSVCFHACLFFKFYFFPFDYCTWISCVHEIVVVRLKQFFVTVLLVEMESRFQKFACIYSLCLAILSSYLW